MKNQNGKIKVVVLFMMVSLLLVLTGCTANSKSSDNANNQDQKVYKLKFNSAYPDTGTTQFHTKEFAKALEERSNGRIQVELYFANELVPQNDLLIAFKSGLVDFGLTQASFFTDTIKTASALSIPFWASTLEDANRITRKTEVGKILQEDFEAKGAKILNYGYSLDYGFGLKKKIETVKDFKGLILRTSGRPLDLWYKELGISGASVPSSDVYDALQRGVIDGAPIIKAQIGSMALGEVVKYFVEPPFIVANFMVMVNNKTWAQLPEDLQKIVEEVALEMEQKGIEYVAAEQTKNEELLAKYGVELIKLSADEEKKFRDSAQPVWDDFAGLNENTAKMAKILRP